MKKFIALILVAFTFASCSNQEVLNDGSDLSLGGFARFKGIAVQTIDFQEGNGSLIYTAEDANSNAVKYRIYKIGAIIGGADFGTVDTDFVYNSLPANVSISLNDLAVLFGITSADITFGDSFKIFAEVTTRDGKVFKGEIPASTNLGVTENNTNNALLTLSARQAMNFSVTVACQSYDQSAMLGTYSVVNDAFEEYPFRTPAEYTFQCVAGPTPNSLRFIDYNSLGTDLIVNIDPAAQSATSARTFIYNNFYTFGDSFAEGASGGLVFSCIGTINLKMRYSVGAGTFGGLWDFTLVKQ